jgi:hypothetical protein
MTGAGTRLPRRLGLCVVLTCLAGCGQGSEPYLQGARDQLALKAEVLHVLQKVRDEESMKAAREPLRQLARREADLTARMRALPQPSAETQEQLLQQLGPQLQDAIDAEQAEVRRIAGLPGGSAFLESLPRLTGSPSRR